jgi:hypothetical protein
MGEPRSTRRFVLAGPPAERRGSPSVVEALYGLDRRSSAVAGGRADCNPVKRETPLNAIRARCYPSRARRLLLVLPRADATVVAVVLLLALVVSACGEEPFEGVFVDGPIIVDAQEDDEYEHVWVSGTIGLVDGCLILFTGHERSESAIGVEWRPGTTWDVAANAVVLPDGRLVNIGDFL